MGRRRLLWLFIAALVLVGCSEPDQEKELKEFFEYTGVPVTSPDTHLEMDNGGQAANPTSPSPARSTGNIWFIVESEDNKEEITRSVKLAGDTVPEMGYWVSDTVNNGNPWKIWDLGGKGVESGNWATTRSSVLNNIEGVEGLTCDTYLDMDDIYQSQADHNLGSNFLALLLAHEATHCDPTVKDEVKGVWAEDQIMNRLQDDRLAELVDVHKKCIGPDKQWKEVCDGG